MERPIQNPSPPTERTPLLQQQIQQQQHQAFESEEVLEADLVGDGSMTYALPTVKKIKHDRFKRIDAATLVKLIDGNFRETVSSFTIVDCRYPYEYQGGHIVSSVNLPTSGDVTKFFIDKATEQQSLQQPQQQSHKLQQQQQQLSGPQNWQLQAQPLNQQQNHQQQQQQVNSRHVVIFHCEFSSQRGPKLMKFLRERDRQVNQYPELMYPEIYLLDGGYKEFYQEFKQYCEPQAYKPMKCKANRPELHRFKKQSKAHKRVRKESMIPEISFEGC